MTMIARSSTVALLVLGALLVGCQGEESNSRQAPQAASSVAAVQANPASVEGKFELVNANVILGWAMDRTKPNQPVIVDIYDDATLLVSLGAGEFRQDLLAAGKGDGKHAFKVATPESLKDGKPHVIHAKCAGVELPSSPRTFNAS